MNGFNGSYKVFLGGGRVTKPSHTNLEGAFFAGTITIPPSPPLDGLDGLLDGLLEGL